METEIKRMCSTWRSQVISYIKEKDRLLNPELYVDKPPTPNAGRNPNLFDDDLVDDDPAESGTSSDSTSDDDSMFQTNEVSTHSANLFEDSHDVSNATLPQNDPSPQPLSNATNREKEIDAELERYQNFNREEFAQLCNEMGLKRSDSKEFEPVGKIVWQFWRRNKNRYPIIYECIKCIITSPTSSSAIEREFSKISAFVTHHKNAFKSPNLLALIQLSEMDDFLRVSSDCFRQNNIEFNFKNLNESEISAMPSCLTVDDILLNFD